MTQLWRLFRPSWSRWAVFVSAIVMSCVAGSASGLPANRESSKAAPPPADVQARVDGEVRELFKAQFAQTAPADRIALAKLLRAKAQEIGQDRAARFVLLREARDLAAAAGNVDDALGAADELAAGFSFDTVKAKRAMLKTLATSIAGAKAQRAFVAACLTASEEAATRDEYEAAVWLCDLAEPKARLVHDPQLTARVNALRSEILRQKRESVAIEPAAERVRANRGSPEDDLAVGRFMCFDRENWDEGLPLLAKGSDPRLNAIARQELSNPAGAEARKRLADQWWALADQEPDLKSAMRRRAAHWYSLAADGLHGLDLALANQRITEQVQANVARYGGDARAPHWVSRNATYTVSSVDPGKDPLPNLLDGRGGGYQHNGFAFHTLNEDRPYIVIDLGSSMPITRVEIVNRRDDLQGRAKTLTMWFADSPQGPWKEVWHAPAVQREWDIDLPVPLNARYVKLGLTEHNILHLYSVKILGFGRGDAP